MKHEHTTPRYRFERLSRLDGYDVAPHEMDPRGWSIAGAEGLTVGEVKDLVVDTDRMKARWVDAQLDTRLFDLRHDPHVLIPLDQVERDGGRRRLVVDGLTAERIGELCEARERHEMEFWDGWWRVGEGRTRDDEWWPRIARRVSSGELHRAIDDIRPGEQVRIPVVNEELVIERRAVTDEERIAARAAADEPDRPTRPPER